MALTDQTAKDSEHHVFRQPSVATQAIEIRRCEAPRFRELASGACAGQPPVVKEVVEIDTGVHAGIYPARQCPFGWSAGEAIMAVVRLGPNGEVEVIEPPTPEGMAWPQPGHSCACDACGRG